MLLSYTEDYAIELMERKLRPYWQRNNTPVAEMLDTAEHEYAELERRGTQYDEELRRDLRSAGGENYANLAILAYRQTLAAHKLVADWDGTPYLFAKENFTNGCIATVDVIYPSAPFSLLLQSAAAGGATAAGDGLCAHGRDGIFRLRRTIWDVSAGQRAGVRRRRAHGREPDAGGGERQYADPAGGAGRASGRQRGSPLRREVLAASDNSGRSICARRVSTRRTS